MWDGLALKAAPVSPRVEPEMRPIHFHCIYHHGKNTTELRRFVKS